jgi:hypothetical protein
LAYLFSPRQIEVFNPKPGQLAIAFIADWIEPKELLDFPPLFPYYLDRNRNLSLPFFRDQVAEIVEG